MKRQRKYKITASFIILLVTFWALGITHVATASNFIPAGRLANGSVIDNDVFTAGPQVTIDGTVNGDVIILGNQVQITGTINGSLIVIGQQVDILGDVAGTAYAGAVSLELGPGTILERNLYFIGATLTSQPESAIQRNLNTICLGADINGKIGGDTRAVIGIVKVIERLIQILGIEIVIPQLNIQSPASVPLSVAGSLAPGLITRLVQDQAPSGTIDTAMLGSWLLDRLRDFGILLILGAIIYWIFRQPLNQASLALRSRPLPALGIGLLALLISTNLFLVGILIASLLFVLGLWMGSLGLWDFTLIFWALTYSALALALTVVWFLIAYGTKLLVSYLAGSWLFAKIAPKSKIPPFLGLVIGALIYILLRSIPMFGWVIGVLVTAWGLGGFWLAYRKSTEPAESAEPAGSD